MKNRLARMSMQKRMMIYFAVPLLIIQFVVAMIFYPALLDKYKGQLDYSREQSVSQALSFVGSYIHNMKYLAEMVENNGEIYGILSGKEFTGARNLDEQYQEFYTLNRTFASLEFSNSLYRFCLYIPEDIIYVSNQYYIFPNTRLEERDDYERMKEYFSFGRDYLALSEERKDISSMDTSNMLTLYHQIRDSDGARILGVCSISIDGERIAQVMENANITSNGLVYLVNAQGEGVAPSNESLFEELKKQGSLPLAGNSNSWEPVRIGRTAYYADREEIENAGWQMVTLVPVSEYDGQFRNLALSAIVAVVVMMIMIMGVSYFLSNYYVGRLKKLSMEMQHLQEGDFTVQLPSVQEGDEVEEVYRNFNFMVGEVRRLLREHFQLGKDAKVAELRTLQAQINPHFLYNTLEMISWMAAKEDKKRVQGIVRSLSRYYKSVLNKGKDEIDIWDEIRMGEAYMEIQGCRFKGKIRFASETDETIPDFPVPKLILQPLLENAIFHGIQKKREGRGSIWLKAYRKAGNVVLEVSDDGVGFKSGEAELESGQGSRYGLANIRRRIELFWGEGAEMRVESTPGIGTSVYIVIPDIRGGEESL